MTTRRGLKATGDRRSASVPLIRPERMLAQTRQALDAIARRAFEIFERNGGEVGRDREHWFQAEAELFHPTHVEIAEGDNVLTVKAEVPGFSGNDLQVSLEPYRVTIVGQRESRASRKSTQTVYTDHCSNEVFRIVDLPKAIDLSARGIQAQVDQGVLTITLPELVGSRELAARQPQTGKKRKKQRESAE